MCVGVIFDHPKKKSGDIPEEAFYYAFEYSPMLLTLWRKKAEKNRIDFTWLNSNSGARGLRKTDISPSGGNVS